MNYLHRKIVIWHGMVAVLAWWMWSSGHSETFDQVTGIQFQSLPVVAFLLLIAGLTLGYILFRQRRWALTTSAIIGIFFLMSFGWTWLNILATLIFLGFNAWSATRVRREMIERKVINIQDAFYHGLTPVVLGLFVMISFAAYQSPLFEQIKSAHQLPSQTQTFLQQIVDKTVGQKIEASTPGQRQQVVKELTSQVFQQINAFIKPYFQYAPPVLAFALFIILWGFSFIFIWLGILVGIALFWILKKSGAVRIEEKDVKEEVLVV